MYQTTLSKKEKLFLQEQIETRKNIVIKLHQYLVRAKVEGLMSIMFETDNYCEETDLLTKYIKRSVNMRVAATDRASYKQAQMFYKDTLLIQNQIPVDQVSYIAFIDAIMEAFYSGDAEQIFTGAFFATQYLTSLPYDHPMIKEMLRELGKLRAQLLYQTDDYTIKKDERYPEMKAQIDEKMEIFRNMDDYDIQRIIRETQSDDLENVLGLCDTEIKNKFIKNTSQVAAQLMLNDIEKKFFGYGEKKASFDDIVKSIDILLLTTQSVLTK